MSETTHILAEIRAEIDTLLRRHKSAANEVAAAIAREAYLDAIEFAGIDAVQADKYFSLHFPTLTLYL